MLNKTSFLLPIDFGKAFNRIEKVVSMYLYKVFRLINYEKCFEKVSYFFYKLN